MLSQKTLRLLTTLSTREKIRAEQTAADAAQRLVTLGGQSATLSAYMADLGQRLAQADIATGLELRSYGQYIELGVRARNINEQQIRAGESAQKHALDKLALATEKHKALQKATDEASAAADLVASRAADHSAGVSGVAGPSSASAKRGLRGLSPPEARHASRRQT
ncbi:MAG: hypothetical protein KGI94_03275 [Paracoccaceae bacterium]|nr:hypothetical protein [Paracoccaceae bacterium]